MKRRRLGDLYVRGKTLTIDDGTDAPVEVWLQKLNDIDRDTLLRRANAAKARFLIEADDEESEAFAAMYGQIREFPRHEGLITLVIGQEVAKARIRIEEQVGHDEATWGKDDYLQGLLDSWTGTDDNPGLAAAQAEDPEDPEAKRVWAEIEKFDTEVSGLVRHEVERLEHEWDEVAPEKLWREATHRMLERQADEIFAAEYDRQQVFFAVREPDDHHQRYFTTISEVDDLEDGIRAHLIAQYNALIVDVLEGKDSPPAPDSSDSSAPPAAETSEPSGLEAVSA